MTAQTNARDISEREFVLEYTFDVPAAKVFAAYTDPKLIPQWWAPRGGSVRVDVMDVRPGGKWRFVQRMPTGQEMIFSGTYVEVQPVTRLVYTFMTEALPDDPLTSTVDLKETDGRTHLTQTNLCVSKEARDAMVSYGAAAGAKITLDRLAEFFTEA